MGRSTTSLFGAPRVSQLIEILPRGKNGRATEKLSAGDGHPQIGAQISCSAAVGREAGPGRSETR